MSQPGSEGPTSEPRQRTGRGALIAIVVLSVLLVLAVAGGGVLWFTRSGDAVVAASATPTPTPSGSDVVASPSSTGTGPGSSDAGSAPAPSSASTARPTDEPAPRYDEIRDISVQREGSGSCSTTNNVPLVAHAYALGGDVLFGVDTRNPKSAPFQDLEATGDLTFTGFVYDCAREEIPYSFVYNDGRGNEFTRVVVLHRCEEGISPRETC